MTTEQTILQMLLDKYERTSEGKNGLPPKRTVSLTLYGKSKTDLEYDITDTKSKNQIHAAAAKLESQKFIRIIWLKHGQKTIIEKLALNPDALNSAYRVLRRIPKSEITRKVLKQLEEALDKLPANDWAWL